MSLAKRLKTEHQVDELDHDNPNNNSNLNNNLNLNDNSNNNLNSNDNSNDNLNDNSDDNLNDNSNQINKPFNDRLKDLPIEIWMLILDKIDLYDLIKNIKLVCKHFNYLVNEIPFKELILVNNLDNKRKLNRRFNTISYSIFRPFRTENDNFDDHFYNNYNFTYLYTNKPMNLQFNLTNYRSNCFENDKFKFNFQNLKYLRSDIDYSYFDLSILNEFKLLEQLELVSNVWLNDDLVLELPLLKTIKIKLFVSNDNCKLILNSKNLLAIECLYLKSIKIINCNISVKQIDAYLEDNYNLEEYLNLNNLIIKSLRDLYDCDKLKLPVLLKKLSIEDKDDNFEIINTLDFSRTLSTKLKQLLLTKYKNVQLYVNGVKIDLNTDFQRPSLIYDLKYLNNDSQFISNLFKNQKLNDKLPQFRILNCNLEKLFDSFDDNIPINFYSTFFNIEQIVIYHKIDQLKLNKFLDNYSNLKSLSLSKIYFDQQFFDQLSERCPNLFHFHLLTTDCLIENLFIDQYDIYRSRNHLRNNFDDPFEQADNHLDNFGPLLFGPPVFHHRVHRPRYILRDQQQQNNRNIQNLEQHHQRIILQQREVIQQQRDQQDPMGQRMDEIRRLNQDLQIRRNNRVIRNPINIRRNNPLVIGPIQVPAIVIDHNIMHRAPNVLNPNNLRNDNELHNRFAQQNLRENPFRILRGPIVQNVNRDNLNEPPIIRIRNEPLNFLPNNLQQNNQQPNNQQPNNQQQNNQQQNNQQQNNQRNFRRIRNRGDIYNDVIRQDKKLNYDFLLKFNYLKTISLGSDLLEINLLTNILKMRNLNLIKLDNNNIEFKISKNKLIDLKYHRTSWKNLSQNKCIQLFLELNSSNNRLIKNIPIRRRYQGENLNQANNQQNNNQQNDQQNNQQNNQQNDQQQNANPENNQANRMNPNDANQPNQNRNADHLNINLELLIGHGLNEIELHLNELFNNDLD